MSQISPFRARRVADLIESASISASALCMVHCLALPVLLFLVPGILGAFFESEAFHVVALGFVVPGALGAFVLGYRRHGRLAPTLIGTLGVALLVAAVAFFEGTSGETVLTVAGSLLLVAGHSLNWRARRACHCEIC